MAVVPGLITDLDNDRVLITWTVDDSTDGGSWVDVSAFTDFTVHADGNWDSGASVTMQGSNNATAAFPLQAFQDGALAASVALADDADAAQILDEPRYMRPLGDGNGGASTAVVVSVIAKKL